MAAQERLLRSVCNLGPRLPKYIRIAASVHTDIDMFVYSQPSIEEGAGESQVSEISLDSLACKRGMFADFKVHAAPEGA